MRSVVPIVICLGLWGSMSIYCLGQSPSLSDPIEQKRIEQVFEQFISTIKERDTNALKLLIHRPDFQRGWFFTTFVGDSNKIRVKSAIMLGGFLGGVHNPDSYIGKCNSRFRNISVRWLHRYAILNAEYDCFVQDHFQHSGLYSIRLLKSDRWRVDNIERYVNMKYLVDND